MTSEQPVVVTEVTDAAHLDLGDAIGGTTEAPGGGWQVALTAGSLSVRHGDDAWAEVDLPEQWTGDATLARVVTYDDGSEHLALDISRAGVLLHADLAGIETGGKTVWRKVCI